MGHSFNLLPAILLLSITLNVVDSITNHYYASLKDLRSLETFQDSYISVLEEYIKEEEEELEKTKSLINLHEINSTIISTTLEFFKKDFKLKFEELHNIGPKHSPDNLGAARAIARIQSTYKVPLNEIKQGLIHGDDGLDLTSNDMFQISQEIFNQGDFNDAIDWLLFLLTNLDDGEILKQEEIWAALDLLHLSFYKVGKLDEAYEIVEMMSKRTSNASKTMEIKKYMKFYSDHPEVENPVVPNENDLKIKRLCRGENKKNFTKDSTLCCTYESHNNNFFLLRPFKKEQVNKDPDIFIYHNFLATHEIKNLLNHGLESKLIISKILSAGSYVADTTFRTSKINWIRDNHIIAQKLQKKVKTLFGRNSNLYNLEQVQLANYGIGGHFKEHLDCSNTNLYENPDTRIASLLLYLTNVEEGGATVFTKIEKSVKPAQGAAVFWHNYDKMGASDELTTHTACPVLYGEKWGANIWIKINEGLLSCPKVK